MNRSKYLILLLFNNINFPVFLPRLHESKKKKQRSKTAAINKPLKFQSHSVKV